MRICPKCAYIEPPIWKFCHSTFHIYWTRIEDFEEHYPHIKLRIGEKRIVGHYAYKRRKGTGQYVERQCLLDNPNAMQQWRLKFEKHNPKRGSNQRRLFQ